MVESELTTPEIKDKNITHNSKSWWFIDAGVPHLVHFTQNIEVFDISRSKRINTEI